MQNITKEKLIEILKNKAIDCFIHNDLLVIDMPNRIVVKNIENKHEYVNIFLESHKKEKNKKTSIRLHWDKYSDYEIELIKKFFLNVDVLVEKTKRSRKGLLRKINLMKQNDELPLT